MDPDARHTRKSGEARRDGYRAHVAADPETGIITDEKLTRASGDENSDPAVAAEFLAAEAGPRAPATTTGPPLARSGLTAPQPPDAAAAAATAGPAGAAGLVRRFRLRHRGPARRDRRCRAPGGDQAQALRPPVKGGLHRRRLRRRRAGRHGHLPGREHRGAQPHPGGHLRRLVPRLPAALAGAPRARPAASWCLHTRDDLLRAARRDWGRAAQGLHGLAAQRGTRRRPGRHLPWPPASSATAG